MKSQKKIEPQSKKNQGQNLRKNRTTSPTHTPPPPPNTHTPITMSTSWRRSIFRKTVCLVRQNECHTHFIARALGPIPV